MPRQCSVCMHRDRDTIDTSLVSGTSYRNIAERYGLSVGAICRHYQNHLPETLTKAHSIKESAQADVLLDRIEGLITKAEGLLDYGQTKKQGRDWAAGLRELRKCFELLARVSGELDERPQINLIATEQWIELRTVILQAIDPYPDAKGKLLEVLDACATD